MTHVLLRAFAIAGILGAISLGPSAFATHDSGCVPGSVNPTTYDKWDFTAMGGGIYYVLHATGDVYEETNWIGPDGGGSGLQLSAADACGHGIDRLVGGASAGGPGPYPFGILILRSPFFGTMILASEPSKCSTGGTLTAPFVSCSPSPGAWVCDHAVVGVVAASGVVHGSAQCANGSAASASSTAPSPQTDQQLGGSWTYPFVCSADFGAGTGWVACN